MARSLRRRARLGQFGSRKGGRMSLRRVILAGVLMTVPAVVPAQDRDGVASFDLSRFSTMGADNFEPFLVGETNSLQQLLADGTVTTETRVLVTDTATGQLALLTDQMAFHHIAQGNENGEPWMVSF